MWVRFLHAGPSSYSIMALHILGKDETQVQFLLRAPVKIYAALANVVIAVD